jgi:thiamine biosynthesis lipoprotein
MRKKILSVLGILVFAGLIYGVYRNSSVEETDTSISKTGFYFDTVIKITLYNSDDADYLDGCFALADKYENLLSATIESSDVSKINAANGSPVTVSPETAELIREGIDYGTLSSGQFDITIGKLSSLWDFSENPGIVPDADAIASAVSTIHYQNITVSGNTVTLNDPDAAIDLGGIAKGFIADKMKAYLNENGITSGIINLGGNVLIIGPKEDGSDYRIGIQKPFSDTGTALATVSIPDGTVVSSGVYERYFKKDGVLYHHLLNPKTGYPYENDLTGVTIICSRSVDGDGLSTTCFSLGLEDGMKLIESLPDTEAIFITSDGELHTSSGIGTTIPFQMIQE